MAEITITETLAAELCFGEGPKWREGHLFSSDVHHKKVYAIKGTGRFETILILEENAPSDLGWLPAGIMLIVSMRKRKLLTLKYNKLTKFADLS